MAQTYEAGIIRPRCKGGVGCKDTGEEITGEKAFLCPSLIFGCLQLWERSAILLQSECFTWPNNETGKRKAQNK
ncbi:MAG: hypothetical protein A4E19_15490 [Nitrospira sp. SG-bin1]|nr:MAG: hypothetical protein A4E19_15490 [Nitrospira sp. SG-bin1]